jgi:nucleoside 2-deoxyribosyltransferase
VVQFDTPSLDIESALGRGIHIINLPSQGMSKDEVLESVLLGAQRKLDTRAGARLRRSRPDIFEDLPPQAAEVVVDSETSAALVQATSKLCFVMMPFSEVYDRIYRDLIVPAIEDAGLSAVRADEIRATGFIMEQIRAAIQQSRLCIADITDRNPNVLYEVGFAEAMRKSVILMASDLSQLPFDVSSQRVLSYSTDLETSRIRLRESIAHVLAEDRFSDAEKLLAAGSPRGAIAVAAVILEHLLQELANRHGVSIRPRASARFIAASLERAGVIDQAVRTSIDQATTIRNEAVHAIGREPQVQEAQLTLETARRLAKIP